MSSLTFMDVVKLTFRVLEFKYEQNKLTTSIYETVKTPKGFVKGVKRLTIWGDAYFSFERIPFAKPPIGELRFRAPVSADPWTHVLDATGPADKPLQSNMIFRKFKGSEDCLYLNVFTKHVKPEQLRPVMVWIYGGGFQIGEASRDMYSPDFFMSKDVVLVTIAYRLGPFGFLSIDDPEVDVPGNAGIKDQILALRWVQENIACFGGDPKNVTVFGESAGGASTHICMISEQSKGLLHKGIVMSGSALCPWAVRPKRDWAYRLAKCLGYKGERNGADIYQFLVKAKGTDLVRGSGMVLTKEEKHNRILFAFTPTVEPYLTHHCVMPTEPREMLKNTWSNDIPMIIGGVSFEGLIFYPEVTRRPATLNEVRNCKNLLPTDAGLHEQHEKLEAYGLRLKRAYFGDEDCSKQTMMQFLDLNSDREFWHPIYRTLRARQKDSTAPTYVYRFDYDSREGNAVRNLLCGRNVSGACHGDDLCYLYHTLLSHRALKDSEEYRITRTMIDIWTNFATNSDPNCDMLEDVIFEPISRDAEIKCLNIAKQIEHIELPGMEKLQIWNEFYHPEKL